MGASPDRVDAGLSDTARGYIQFTIAGGIEFKASLGSGTFDAAGDENSVMFPKKAEPEFQALREAVEAAIHEGASAPTVVGGGSTVAEALRELKALHDDGILTDDEYETKRKALTDQL